MSKTIGELTAASVPVPDDSLLEVEVSGVSKQMSIADLLSITGTVEQGSNSNGSWVRFSSGVQICYMRIAVSSTIDTAWGGAYLSDLITGITYPKAFSALPSVSIFSVLENTGVFSSWAMARSDESITATPKFYLVRGASGTAETYYVSIMAIGEWE